MRNAVENFNELAREKVADKHHREILKHNTSVFEGKYEKALKEFPDVEAARKKAAGIRRNVLENLENLLKTFESAFIKNGGKVIWAVDDKQALDEIVSILKSQQVKKVVKSKSMATEELDLNKHLEKHGIEALETDLGEYIVQLKDEKPYHITAPALHYSKEKVAELYHQKFGLDKESTVEEITAYTRKKLRDEFRMADAGISGANFLLAAEGAVALTENEGNGLLTFSYPDLHIIVAGIDKILPSVKDLDLFWRILSAHGTGQKLTAYNSLIKGPGEYPDKKVYVILMDNGRSRLLSKPEQREALCCIRCGACMNVCPVYKIVGGHAYGSVYNGPIGAVILPHMKNMEEFAHLSFASSLCGRCNEVCPVKIDISKLLLKNRRDAVNRKLTPSSDRRAIKMYAWVMGKRSLLESIPHGVKSTGMKLFFKKEWGKNRALPFPQKKSFHRQWKEKNDI